MHFVINAKAVYLCQEVTEGGQRKMVVKTQIVGAADSVAVRGVKMFITRGDATTTVMSRNSDPQSFTDLSEATAFANKLIAETQPKARSSAKGFSVSASPPVEDNGVLSQFVELDEATIKEAGYDVDGVFTELMKDRPYGSEELEGLKASLAGGHEEAMNIALAKALRAGRKVVLNILTKQPAHDPNKDVDLAIKFERDLKPGESAHDVALEMFSEIASISNNDTAKEKMFAVFDLKGGDIYDFDKTMSNSPSVFYYDGDKSHPRWEEEFSKGTIQNYQYEVVETGPQGQTLSHKDKPIELNIYGRKGENRLVVERVQPPPK